jgi:hypothetical protein
MFALLSRLMDSMINSHLVHGRNSYSA